MHDARMYLVHALDLTILACPNFSASLLLDFPKFSASLLLCFSTPKIKKKLKHAHFSCIYCTFAAAAALRAGARSR